MSRLPLGTTAAYLALVLVATYPAVFSLGSAVIGDSESDMWKHLWGLWWFRHTLINEHTLPLFTTDINYPQGGYLYFADPMTALLSVPLQAFLGLTCSYNVLMMGQLLGGCLGAYLLGRTLGLERMSAFTTGVVYGLSPYVLSYSVASGVTETVNLAWPPLYLLFLTRCLRNETGASPVAAGALLFATAFGCWYYAEFLLLMTVIVVLFGDPPSLPRATNVTAMLSDVTVRARRVFPAMVIGFCLILPFATTFAQVLGNPYNLVTPDKHGRPSDPPMQRNARTAADFLGENQLNFTGLLDFVTPGKENATTTTSMDRLTRVYYLGSMTCLLTLTGLLAAPRPWPRSVHFWLWTTVGFAFLSLGPTIHLRSTSLEAARLGVSWPYWFFFHGFPLFKQIGQPFRLMLLVYLGLGLLCGFGLQGLQARFPRVARGAWLCPLVILAETLWASPTPYPMPMSPATVPPVYQIIAASDHDEAVWDVPEEWPESLLQPSRYYYYQTFHGHPIPYRTSGQVSPQIRANKVRDVVVLLMSGGIAEGQAQRFLQSGLSDLRAMKVRWFVIHRNILGPQRTSQLVRFMTSAVGAPVHEDADIVAYRLY